MSNFGSASVLLPLLLLGCGTSSDAESPAISRTTTQSAQPTEIAAPEPRETPPTIQIELVEEEGRNPGVRVINTGAAPTQLLSSLRMTPTHSGVSAREIELRRGPRRGLLTSDATQQACLSLAPGAELVLPTGSAGVALTDCEDRCPEGTRHYRFTAQSCLRTHEIHSDLWNPLGPKDTSGAEPNSAPEEAAPAPQGTR